MSSDAGLSLFEMCPFYPQSVHLCPMVLRNNASRLILLHSIDSRIQYKLASLCYNCLNNLPCKVRSTNTLASFKSSKSHLIKLYCVRALVGLFRLWDIITPGSLLCNEAGPCAPAWKNGTTKSALLLPKRGAGIVQYLERLTRGRKVVGSCPGGTGRRENFPRQGQLCSLISVFVQPQ